MIFITLFPVSITHSQLNIFFLYVFFLSQIKDKFPASALKKIFLEYATVQDATNAGRELSGRQFGSNVVATTYFNETEYAKGQLS